MALKKKSQSRKAAPKAAVKSKSRARPSKKASSRTARIAGIRKAALLATVLALFAIAFAQNSEAQTLATKVLKKDQLERAR